MSETRINPYIARCLSLARQGIYTVKSNPRVGAVVVYNEQVIGEGYHHRRGQPHAEVNAVSSVQDKSQLVHSTIYVSLEPCSHYGLTPPCCQLIIEHKIPKVVLSLQDPNTQVRGIDRLQKAGVEVVVLEDELSARENTIFTTNHTDKRPFVILKWAQSKDGLLDRGFRRTTISKPSFSRITHHIRATVHGILIGKGTLKTDCPTLTTRFGMGDSPVPILLDSKLECEQQIQGLRTVHDKLIVVNSIKEGSENGVMYILNPDSLLGLLKQLYRLGIYSLLVEGGGEVLQNFIWSNCWDEACRLTSDQALTNGTAAPKMTLSPYETFVLEHHRVEYFANNE